jgi:hypothetical protein
MLSSKTKTVFCKRVFELNFATINLTGEQSCTLIFRVNSIALHKERLGLKMHLAPNN